VCLQDAKLKYSDIDEVILVGGSTRIPAVQVRAWLDALLLLLMLLFAGWAC
jgi:hypothetical protein